MIDAIQSFFSEELVGTKQVGFVIHYDENMMPLYDQLVWESEEYDKPTKEEFDAAFERATKRLYQADRRNAYPSIEDQLDALFHQGYDGWKTIIQSVKDQFPKPEVS